MGVGRRRRRRRAKGEGDGVEGARSLAARVACRATGPDRLEWGGPSGLGCGLLLLGCGGLRAGRPAQVSRGEPFSFFDIFSKRKIN